MSVTEARTVAPTPARTMIRVTPAVVTTAMSLMRITTLVWVRVVVGVKWVFGWVGSLGVGG